MHLVVLSAKLRLGIEVLHGKCFLHNLENSLTEGQYLHSGIKCTLSKMTLTTATNEGGGDEISGHTKVRLV